MRAAVGDPLVGRVLEQRYLLGEQLARGGMSTVYVARDLRLDRAVAVKVMPSDLSHDPAFTDRFAREARAAAKLAHLNVVQVHDQGDDAGHVFLVMELVRGRTVRDLLHERGALPLPLALAVMAPVLAALSAAHRAGLVHRDVKPENVLLSDDGLVKVADFGLARAVESDPSSTRTNLMMGTVAYCSPEHVTAGVTDARSDVYAAGVLLFELLTGRVPYVGENSMQVAWQHVHSRVPAPSSRVHGVPDEIDDLVLRATDRDPADRPPDAGAFLAELHDLRTALRIPVPALPVGGGRDLPAVPDVPPTADAATGVLRAQGPARAVVDPAAATGRIDHRPGPTTTSRWDDRTAALSTQALGTTALRTGGPTAGVVLGAGPTSSPAPGLDSPPSTPPPAAGPMVTGPDDWPSRRRRRRRRTLALAVVVALVAAAVGYGSWWYAAGRWAAVPNVVGRASSDAGTLIRAAGFEVGGTPAEQFSETVPSGAVISTDPGAGQRRVHGATVAMVVSRGAERFDVPDVANLSEADARQKLSSVPVTVSTTAASSDTVPAGVVIGSDPPAGTAVKRDAAVTLTVSSGPPILPVPDVVGQGQDAATSTLSGAGFQVAAGDPQFSDTVPTGAVISQTPAGGGTAVKFSTVTIVVSKGVDLVAVPSIPTGASVSTATAVLQQAGFQVAVKKAYGGLLGTVVAVDPKAGTQLKRGSTVTITSV